MFVFNQPIHHEQDATQNQFLKDVQLVRIQSFPFPKLVALSRQKKSTLLFTYHRKVLALCETQTSSSISYDDIYYTTKVYVI